MIRINRLTDYGFVLLAQLAHEREDAPRSTSELASATNIPVPTVRKVLKELTAADVLTSERGAHGGYRLARPAADITAHEVIAALEGPVSITLCSPGPGECELEDACPVALPWKRINGVIQGALRSITLAELIGPRPDRIGAGADHLVTIGSGQAAAAAEVTDAVDAVDAAGPSAASTASTASESI